jgi:hypothetical protein
VINGDHNTGHGPQKLIYCLWDALWVHKVQGSGADNNNIGSATTDHEWDAM